MERLWFRLICATAFSLGATASQALAAAPSDEARRAELNSEQADFAQHQLEENAANRRTYDEAVQARLDAIQRDQSAYAQRQADYEAEKARMEREHEEAIARWRADVAACKAGNADRCAHN